MENKTPQQLAEELIFKAENYSRYSGEFAEKVKLQAEFFNSFRGDHKSDNATQKAFDATKDGVRMTILKLKLKALEKEMSAVRTYLRLLENQAKNLY